MFSNGKNPSYSIAFLGLNNKFFCFSYKIFIYALILQCILYLLLDYLRYFVVSYKKVNIEKETKNPSNVVYNSYIFVGETIIDLVSDSVGFVSKDIFSFFTSFFLMMIFYNCGSLIPHLEEINKDLNACLAFSIFGFLYVQYFAIKKTGALYLNHWISNVVSPSKSHYAMVYYIYYFLCFLGNAFVTIILLPFTILEKASFLFALSFRLFGNLFGGSIVMHLVEKAQSASILYYLGTTIFGIQLLVSFYFGLFEGFLQAFIFTLILMNSLSSLIAHEK